MITVITAGATCLIARFMGPIWGRQDPGGPHVGPMNFAIWDAILPHHDSQYFRLLDTNFLHHETSSNKNRADVAQPISCLSAVKLIQNKLHCFM